MKRVVGLLLAGFTASLAGQDVMDSLGEGRPGQGWTLRGGVLGLAVPAYTGADETRLAALPVGILDWYTVLVGLFALVMIAGHGALFLAWKTEGPVQARSASAARAAWLLVGLSWGPVSLATGAVSPALFDRFPEAPLAWLAALLVLAGVGLLAYGMNRGRWKLAFFGSCGLIVGLLAGAAAMVFPDLLRSTLDPTHSLNAWNAASPATGLRKALVWWLVGFPLAALYFANLFRLHRGKAKAAPEGEGY